uniref:RING-type domain-containing protein n=1 Tax=Plectus sambesii TaxID=2011161 RepID=A0A914VXR4_9BILA
MALLAGVFVLHSLMNLMTAFAAETNTTKMRTVLVEFVDESCVECGLKTNRTVNTAEGVLLSPMKVESVESADKDVEGSAAVHVACDGTECLPSTFNSPFVAILQYPNADVAHRSIIGAQVHQAILWGASAVILLTKGADAVDHWQFNDTFIRPVILITENVSNIIVALARSSRLMVVLTEKISTDAVHLPTRLTLWALCGRQTALVKNRRGDEIWEGTVCMEPPAGSSHPSEWTTVAVLGSVFGLLLLLNVIGQEPGVLVSWLVVHDGRALAQTESERHRMATKVLERLRSVKLTLSSLMELAVDNERLEACAICLEEYALDQVMRILPCNHSFHQTCVDPWIIKRQICPLCKREIVLPITPFDR